MNEQQAERLQSEHTQLKKMQFQSLVKLNFMLVAVLGFKTAKSEEISVKRDTNSQYESIAPPNHKDKSKPSITLGDINAALQSVSNESEEFDELISKMFDPREENRTYAFRLPQVGAAKRTILTIQRSDFAQPSFPNLTASYVRLMKSKTAIKNAYEKHIDAKTEKGDDDLWHSNSVDEDDPTLFFNLQTERSFIEYVNNLNDKDENYSDKVDGYKDDWSLLGLDGWTGLLSKPNNDNRPVFNDQIKQQVQGQIKRNTQKWDLPGKMEETSLEHNLLQSMKNTSFFKILGNFSQKAFPVTKMHSEHSDSDVYIGRVNDPFGHSTKNNTSDAHDDDRKKRAVVELYSMIKCSTGCDPIIYKGYGCYCGFLGDGVSVDGIDQCCKLHDKCYEYSNCISYSQYFVPYIWKCYRGKPLCAIDHGQWGGLNSCAAKLCKCDLNLSRCLRRFVCPQRRAICRTSKARMLQNILFNF